jgi:hypothetical protein
LEKVNIIHKVENNPNMPVIEIAKKFNGRKWMFTLCLLNVVIEKNTDIVIKLCLFNALIFRKYFVLM